ncbi:MAG: GTPase [Planctomycetota bacterium]|nr:GTPase [Planctomycetota bacterium]
MGDPNVGTYRILTPPGVGAVAVVLLQGDPVPLLLQREREVTLRWPGVGHVVHAQLADRHGVLDDVVAVGIEGGAEVHVHGGPGVVRGITDSLTDLSWKEDLLSVPLPELRCMRQVRAWASARNGPLADLAREVQGVLAGEEQESAALDWKLERVFSLEETAKRFLEPPVIRIVGQPNAGKSSLFNALLGSDRALASPHSGTTRDSVRALGLLRGLPVVWEDTAGMVFSDQQKKEVDLPVDLVVHLMTDSNDPPWSVGEVPVIALLGKGDQRVGELQIRSVSGQTGEGLDWLFNRVAETLSISQEGPDDIWVPVDSMQKAVFRHFKPV